MIRLNKLLVQKGLCSRREADRYIRDGLVTVNGVVQTQLGVKVPMDEQQAVVVELLPAAQRLQNQQATILFHKPLGIVSCQPELGSSPSLLTTKKDQQDPPRRQLLYTPAIQCCTAEREYDPFRQKKKSNQQQQRLKRGRSSTSSLPEPRQQTGWAVAGRLDINSTGLLVLTQSGRLASQIIRPDSTIEKEYLVRLSKTPSKSNANAAQQKPSAGSVSSPASAIVPRLDGDFPETLAILQRFHEGILDQEQLLQAERVDIINDEQVRFVLRQGKHHQIRRMCAAVGWSIQALKRVRIGKVVLGDLPLGQWRYLGKHESFQ